MKKPIQKVNNDKICIIFKFVIPQILKIFNSSFSITSIKKNKVLIKNINGNISNKTEGTFKRVKYIGNKMNSSLPLKKFISSNKFIISITVEKTKVTLAKLKENFLNIYIL